MIRLLLLLISFSVASKELKPLEELLNVEMDVNTGTIFLLKKCFFHFKKLRFFINN